MVPGVSVEVGPAAVVLVGERPLRVLSSAVVRGGFTEARAIVNLHVHKKDPCLDPAAMIDAFARRARVPAPWIGLLTGALTERARVGHAATEGYRALAVTTVGLSNLVSAGHSPIAVSRHSTINTVVVVDADPEPAALVNAVITVTEVKGLALRTAGLVMPDGKIERVLKGHLRHENAAPRHRILEDPCVRAIGPMDATRVYSFA